MLCNILSEFTNRLDTLEVYERSSGMSDSFGLDCLVESTASLPEFGGEIETSLAPSGTSLQTLKDTTSTVSSNYVQSSEDVSLVPSTQLSPTTTLNHQHSFALVFIIFVMLSSLLHSFLFPLILCTLMFLFCIL